MRRRGGKIVAARGYRSVITACYRLNLSSRENSVNSRVIHSILYRDVALSRVRFLILEL